MIAYGKQDTRFDEFELGVDVLKSDLPTWVPIVFKFEEASGLVKAKYVTDVNSAKSAVNCLKIFPINLTREDHNVSLEQS